MELCDLQSCVEALHEDGAVEEYQVNCNNTVHSALEAEFISACVHARTPERSAALR